MAIRFSFLLALPALAEGALCMGGSTFYDSTVPFNGTDDRTCAQFQSQFFMQDLNRTTCYTPFTLTFNEFQGSVVLTIAEAAATLAMLCCSTMTSPCAQYLPTPDQMGLCPANFSAGEETGMCFLCNGTIGYVDPLYKCARCSTVTPEGCRDQQSCGALNLYWDGSMCIRCSASDPFKCPPSLCSMYGGRHTCYGSDPSSCYCQSCSPSTFGDISACGEMWCKNYTNMRQFNSSWQCMVNETGQMNCQCDRCCADGNCGLGQHYACDQARCTPSVAAPDVKWINESYNGMTWGRCARCVYEQNGARDTSACMTRAQCESVGFRWACPSDNMMGCCKVMGGSSGGTCTSLTSQDVMRFAEAGWVPKRCSN